MTLSSLDDRVCGDDWVWIWDCGQDLSKWTLSTLVVTISAGPLKTSDILAQNEGSIVTTGSTGSGPQDVPASHFAASGSVLSFIVVRASTSLMDPAIPPIDDLTDPIQRTRTLYLAASCKIDGARTTFMPALPFLARSSIDHV